MQARVVFVPVALSLVLASCGGVPTPPSGARLASAKPPLALTSGSYFISTGCSPHSVNISLTLRNAGLTVHEDSASYRSTTWDLEYESSAITTTLAYDHVGGRQTTQAVARSGDNTYAAVLSQVTGDVEKVAAGNLCFPSRPELAVVIDYLRSLAQPQPMVPVLGQGVVL